MMEARVNIEIGEWIVRAALAGANEIEILGGLCERMIGAGLPLVRASVANDLLDPTFGGRGVRWLRGQGGLEEPFARVDDALADESWTRSPFFAWMTSVVPSGENAAGPVFCSWSSSLASSRPVASSTRR